MPCMRAFFHIAVLCMAAEAVTPIEKVTSLLEDLKKSTEAEGKAEAATYEKFACFCKEATEKKSKSITEGQDTIDTTTADIGSKTATRSEKITQLGKEQTKVEETTTALQVATEAYQKDKTTYEGTYADLSKALSSMQKALTALKDSKKGAAFLSLGDASDVRNALDMAEALGLMQPTAHQAVTAFVERVDPSDPAYEFHSDRVIGIVESLQTDFQKNRDEVQGEWEKTDKSFKSEKSDMEGKIDTAKTEINRLTGEIDKLKSEIATEREELVNAESTLDDDSKYLSDLTTRCEAKAKAWDQRTRTRNEEVTALTQALSILQGDKLKDTDTVNKRALLIARKAPATVKSSVTGSQPVISNHEPRLVLKSKAVSLLQVGEKTRGFLSRVKRVELAEKKFAIDMLREEGIRLNSVVLSSLATQIAANPFDKIKTLIQGLIERLLTESKQEATKKGFCDTQLGKSEETRTIRLAEINKIDAELAELEAQQGKLESEVKRLTEDIKGLQLELKKATDLRREEKEENEKTLKEAKEGAVAVGNALTILQDFYKSAAKVQVLLQVFASPVDEKAPGVGFEGAYKGSQDSSKAILGLLKVIKTDFERTVMKTEAAEEQAHEEFVAFERSSKADIAGKQTKVVLDTQDLESTKSGIEVGMKNLKTTTNLLDGALKNIEELKPTCIDTGMSYKERVQKREEEMKALKSAMCMLDAEKVEAECK